MALGSASQDRFLQSAPEIWDGHDVLDVRIEADFHLIRTEDRHPDAPLRRGSISLSGDSLEVPALIRTRGNLRLQRSFCYFPPLRIRIDTDAVAREAIPPELRGLGNARVVSPCRGGQDHLVLLEYLAYRIYNVMSPVSYAVRPVRITFLDSSGRDQERTVLAFLIESDGHLARRLRLEPASDTIGRVDPRLLEPRSTALLEAFQYMIGNTDWSVEARHNILVATDSASSHVAIPYDFDFAGIVDAPYAAPDARLPIDDVTDRLYRGLCRPRAEMKNALDLILSRRDGVLAELDAVEELSDFRRRRARRYLEDFFREASGGRALANFIATCR